MKVSNDQLELALMGRLDGPSVVPDAYIKQCASYRDAVRLCWSLRRIKYMSLLQLAGEVGFPQGHRSDYLSADDSKREMPAKYIAAFESVCGNTAISQWIAKGAKLTVLEELQMQRAA